MVNNTDYKKYQSMLTDKVKPIGEYLPDFKAACETQSKRISTGYLSIDKILNGGFANELYIMGAETSTGKSAILMDMAQHIALDGTDVLYFALEMSKDEFIARGISSLSYKAFLKDNSKKKLTAGNILYYTYDDAVKDFTKLSYSHYDQYVQEYGKLYGEHLHIIESGLTGLTVKDIANIAALYKKQHDNQPVVVFIDYLQMIKADPEDRTQSDRKTKIDISVSTLKVLASQIGMPVITISSVNRGSYNGKIKTSAFKESGDTEYTGGVLIGWNWEGVTNETDPDKIKAEKNNCRERGFRKMSFEILKNRNSERDTSVHFCFYPAYSYFEEYDEWEPASKVPFLK